MAMDRNGRDVTPQGLPVGWSDSPLNSNRREGLGGGAVVKILKIYGYLMILTAAVLVLMMVVGSVASLFG
jgi:hypothetical protein